jgi:hypothetical protein
MSIFTLSEDDPMVVRLKAMNPVVRSEIGYIPGDEYGCKIYGRIYEGRLTMIGIHSKVYGCPKTSTDSIQIMPSLKEVNGMRPETTPQAH